LIEGKHLYGDHEKKDQPPFNQQGGEDLSSPQKLLIKKVKETGGKVLRDVKFSKFHIQISQY